MYIRPDTRTPIACLRSARNISMDHFTTCRARRSAFSMIDFTVILLAAVLIFTPCFAMLWKRNGCRHALWRAGYTRWVVCCDRLFGDDLHDRLERGTQNRHQTTTGYRSMLTPRELPPPANSLRLTAWRESVHRHSSFTLPITTQVEHIQIKPDSIAREEPGRVATHSTEQQIPCAPTQNNSIDVEVLQRFVGHEAL
jgi:hypothetical protein